MPALRQARQELRQAQREVAVRTKAFHAAELAVALVRAGRTRTGSKHSAAGSRSALIEANKQLRSAIRAEVLATRRLANVIASESARSSAETKARVIALYKQQQEQKTEADLQKAVARFVLAWKRRRQKINARRLAAKTMKAVAQAVKADKKANAKARAAVEQAAALAKARARKAATRAGARAARLKLRTGG